MNGDSVSGGEVHVCRRSGSPILAVEFDGLGHGFSRDGQYLQVLSADDPHRKLKLDTKLGACDASGFPIVVVSYPESGPIDDRDCQVSVLDAVIGEVLSGSRRQELLKWNLKDLGAAIEADPSGDAADAKLLEMEFVAEQESPIRRKILELQRQLPIAFSMNIHPLDDRPGFVGARQAIRGGLELSGSVYREKVLLSFDVYVRNVNCKECETFDLANVLAEYGLVRKAIRAVGTTASAWRKLQEETPWTEGRGGAG